MKKILIAMAVVIVVAISLFAFQSVDYMKRSAEAFIYAYPQVVMKQTLNRSLTGDMSINQFTFNYVFPDHNSNFVVRPNRDTLYAFAWLDLADDAVVIDIPDMGNRYYIVPFMDSWTNNFTIVGSKNTGNEAQRYLVTGPFWQGQVPSDMTQIASPTNTVLVPSRTAVNGQQDLEAAIAKMQYQAVTLSDWKGGVRKTSNFIDQNIDGFGDDPNAVIAKMRSTAFFNEFTDLIVANPPMAGDSEQLERLASIGIQAGQEYKPSMWQAFLAERAIDKVLAKINLSLAGSKERVDGWTFLPENIGDFGNDYTTRAAVAVAGLGALSRSEAFYSNVEYDSKDRLLDTEHAYVIHFNADQLPPVDGFWSLTMYDKQGFMIKNPINRYDLGDRSNLVYNDDGSLDIYIQKNAKQGAENNWLPSPSAGEFSILLRAYWPREAIISGQWLPPGIKRVE
jgi:hypothetical protein